MGASLSVISPSTSVRLCLPDGATQAVQISEARLVLETEDGTNLLDRDTQLRLAAAWDGQVSTAASLTTGTLDLVFDRSVALDSARMLLAEGAGRAALDTTRAQGKLVGVDRGWTALPLAPGTTGGASMRLQSSAASVRVSEILLTGSPSGIASTPS